MDQWEKVREQLTEWDEDLPSVDLAELSNLLSMKAMLPGLLYEAETADREFLNDVIRERIAEGKWTSVSPMNRIFLRERFEWAFAQVEAMERCGIQAPATFRPEALLIEAWDAGGASYTHEDFLRKFLPDMLGSSPGGWSDMASSWLKWS
jgi:hypothetical protein